MRYILQYLTHGPDGNYVTRIRHFSYESDAMAHAAHSGIVSWELFEVTRGGSETLVNSSAWGA